MGIAQKITGLPPRAWDTHVHVFDSSIGPFDPKRAYTPGHAPSQSLVEFSGKLTEDAWPSNLVLVQPSPYGTDNTVLLESLRQLQTSRQVIARGVAVIDLDSTSDEELWAMHECGIRGVRLNMRSDGQSFSATEFAKSLTRAAERIQNLPNWKLQTYCSGFAWDHLYDTVLNLPVQVIADHFGGLCGTSKLGSECQDARKQAGFESLLKLAEEGKVLIKISAFYRASTRGNAGYDDLRPLVQEMAKRVPERLLYASDWPHTGEGSDRRCKNLAKVEQFRSIDNALIIRNLRQWVQSEETWQRMMVETPSSTYQ